MTVCVCVCALGVSDAVAIQRLTLFESKIK